MAYLTFTGSDETSSCFKFIGSNTTSTNNGGLISSNTSLISENITLISSSSDSGLDTCSFYSGPSDSTIMAFGESFETCGTVAYNGGGETCGTVAFSGGGETCGSIASSSSSFSSGGCSYSC